MGRKKKVDRNAGIRRRIKIVVRTTVYLDIDELSELSDLIDRNREMGECEYEIAGVVDYDVNVGRVVGE